MALSVFELRRYPGQSLSDIGGRAVTSMLHYLFE